MEFDKSKVYTALNADELRVGSKVVLADSLANLKDCVEHGDDIAIDEIVEIRDARYEYRFFDGYASWQLAYLIEPPEEKKLCWTQLKVGDVIKKPSCEGYRFAMVVRIDTYATRAHIGLEGEWLDAEQLEEWEIVK